MFEVGGLNPYPPTSSQTLAEQRDVIAAILFTGSWDHGLAVEGKQKLPSVETGMEG